MKTFALIPLFLGLAVAGSACSTTTNVADNDTRGGACLVRDAVQKWSAPDDSRLVLTDYSNVDFDVMFFEDCPGLTKAKTLHVNWTKDMCVHGGDKITIKQSDADKEQICEIIDVYPSVPIE